MKPGHLVQELRELGLRGALFRLGWELKVRTDWAAKREAASRSLQAMPAAPSTRTWPGRLFFPTGEEVRSALADRLPLENLERLRSAAEDAARGKILCFGRWTADFGSPIDWQLNPMTGRRWPNTLWTQAMRRQQGIGDIKLTWEVGRFPQAYLLARAGVFSPDEGLRQSLATALSSQMLAFLEQNPRPHGVHWGSGQEIVLRLMAWMFGEAALLQDALPSVERTEAVGRALADAAYSLEAHIEYARQAVYNNHLLAEALGLLLVGGLLEGPQAQRWQAMGERLLTEGVARQFYDDGGYLQQSHNYHRVALVYLLWASCFLRHAGRSVPSTWLEALDRSLHFLHAQQAPGSGSLPNFGANDGALPSILDTCDYSDFRPVLQTVSALVRGKRLYDAGPWDEAMVWMLGVKSLGLPLPLGKDATRRRSQAFPTSGQHVLRGRDEETFATFRCGSLRDRFGQLDMLHLDVWWRGQNVLVDGGSYLYNGPSEWHDHFMRTGSHNTVQLDDVEQMVHLRRFKTLYPTQARLLGFQEDAETVLVTGEHDGFGREVPGAIHRRSVLFLKEEAEAWVVVDSVRGTGAHRLRLHWLGGAFPYVTQADGLGMSLRTPAGSFDVRVYPLDDQAMMGDVVSGATQPIRGWVSRYYGEKVAVPSLRICCSGGLPLGLVSVLGPEGVSLERSGPVWHVRTPTRTLSFVVQDGVIEQVRP